MNLGRVGGLLEAKKVAALAEVHYAQIAPHLYCGPVVGAANIQIAACSPNFLILESIQQWGGFHARILKKPIRWEEGYVIPPTAPGLGVELDEAVALAHPYAGGGCCISRWRSAARLNAGGTVDALRFHRTGTSWESTWRRIWRAADSSVAVFDLDRSSADAVLAAGARWAASVAALANACDCLITCLPSPEATACGAGGGAAGHAAGQHLDRDEHQRFRRGRGACGARRKRWASPPSPARSPAACIAPRPATSRY